MANKKSKKPAFLLSDNYLVKEGFQLLYFSCALTLLMYTGLQTQWRMIKDYYEFYIYLFEFTC